jgi:hypothetical protein
MMIARNQARPILMGFLSWWPEQDLVGTVPQPTAVSALSSQPPPSTDQIQCGKDYQHAACGFWHWYNSMPGSPAIDAQLCENIKEAGDIPPAATQVRDLGHLCGGQRGGLAQQERLVRIIPGKRGAYALVSNHFPKLGDFPVPVSNCPHGGA